MSNSESTRSSESLVASGSITRARGWIFGILTLAGAGAFLYTWFQPWWTANIIALKENGITIFPYAMVIGGTLKDFPQWLVGAQMPGWFFRVMWVYLAASMAALLISLFVGKEMVSLGKSTISLQKLLVGLVGLSYIVIVVGCAIVIAIRAPQFYGASLQGTVFVHMAEHEGNAESYVETRLQLGYWLACGVGPLLVVLALLHDKIMGKPGLNAG
jgi:hypothetical protein